MKKNIHPNYRPVVFKDLSSDFAFLTRSTVETKETIKWEDGKEYPLYKIEISSASHPFYTGEQKLLILPEGLTNSGKSMRTSTLRRKRHKICFEKMNFNRCLRVTVFLFNIINEH